MKKKMFLIFLILLSFSTLLSLWLFPTYTSSLGMIYLFFSLAFSTYTIIQTHKGAENTRPKTLKDVGLLVLTLILIFALGGIAAMLANSQVSVRWGEIAGLLSAIGASFLVGYLVRKGMGRLEGR